MQKINFQDLPSTATPLNASNMNAIQSNVEDVFDGDVPMGQIIVENVESKNIIGTWLVGGIDSTTGALTTSDSAKRTDYIKVDFSTNTNYHLSGLYIEKCSLFIAAYNSAQEFLGRTGAYIKSGQTDITLSSSSFTSGTPQGTGAIRYLIVTLYSPDSGYSIENIIKTSNIQLEAGSTASNYSPYKGYGYVSGESTNGKYIKYDDGTLICWNTIVVNNVAITTQSAGMYASSVIDPFPSFPVTFVSSPAINVSSSCASEYGSMVMKHYPPSTTKPNNLRIFGTWSSTQNVTLSYIAYGRWK